MTTQSGMLTPAGLSPDAYRLLTLGWQALVEKLGYADATQFIMLLDKGSGDAVKYFRDLWAGQSAEEIYRQMLAARSG